MIACAIMHLDEVKDGQSLCYIYSCSKTKLMCWGDTVYLIVWFILDSKLHVRPKQQDGIKCLIASSACTTQ